KLWAKDNGLAKASSQPVCPQRRFNNYSGQHMVLVPPRQTWELRHCLHRLLEFVPPLRTENLQRARNPVLRRTEYLSNTAPPAPEGMDALKGVADQPGLPDQSDSPVRRMKEAAIRPVLPLLFGRKKDGHSATPEHYYLAAFPIRVLSLYPTPLHC